MLIISVLGVASAAFLLWGEPPRLNRVDPTTVTYTLVSILIVIGGVVPLVALLLWKRHKRPSFALAIVCVAVVFVHALSLGAPVVVPGQSLTSLLALVLSGTTAMTVLILAMEQQRAKPAHSALRP